VHARARHYRLKKHIVLHLDLADFLKHPVMCNTSYHGHATYKAELPSDENLKLVRSNVTDVCNRGNLIKLQHNGDAIRFVICESLTAMCFKNPIFWDLKQYSLV